MSAAEISAGALFRKVSSAGKVWGTAITEKLVWHVVKEFAAKIGVQKLAPHDLRRYAESQIMPNPNATARPGGPVEWSLIEAGLANDAA